MRSTSSSSACWRSARAGPGSRSGEARQRLAGFDPDDYRARSERLRTAALVGELAEASRAKEAEAADHRQRLNEIEADLRSRAESLQTTRLSEAEAAAADVRQQPATEGAGLVHWRRRRRAATALRAAEQRAENERATLAAVRAGSADPTSLIDSDDALITERRAVREADDAVRSRLGELRSRAGSVGRTAPAGAGRRRRLCSRRGGRVTRARRRTAGPERGGPGRRRGVGPRR